MIGWEFYGTKDLQVCPYMPGVPVHRDGMLPALYYSLKEEGTLLQTFCQHQTLDSFIAHFDRLKTLQVLCSVRPDNTLFPRGFSWVDNPRGQDGSRVVLGGMAFFGGVGKTPVARALAKLALGYVFEDLRVDVIQGLQDVRNISGRNFFRRLGFREDAIVHDHFSFDGQFVDARVLILRKRDFWPGFVDWKRSQDVNEEADFPVAREEVLA